MNLSKLYQNLNEKKGKNKTHFFWQCLAPMRNVFAYSKTCVKWPPSKRPKIGFQDQLSFNAGQKYCRMLQVEHSAILLTFIKLPFVIKIFVLSIFEWPFYTGFTVLFDFHSFFFFLNMLLVFLDILRLNITHFVLFFYQA